MAPPTPRPTSDTSGTYPYQRIDMPSPLATKQTRRSLPLSERRMTARRSTFSVLLLREGADRPGGLIYEDLVQRVRTREGLEESKSMPLRTTSTSHPISIRAIITSNQAGRSAPSRSRSLLLFMQKLKNMIARIGCAGCSSYFIPARKSSSAYERSGAISSPSTSLHGI